MDDLAIGIDLGTTNSCVSIFSKGKCKTLENSDGGKTTPSFIYYTDLDGFVVGEHAKRMSKSRPDYGIYEIKRLLGRKFNDPYVQNIVKYVPFRVESDDSNNPVVVIPQRLRLLKKTPEDLSAIILQKLRKDAERKLGQSVTNAVITIPAYFSVNQREATVAAAKKAGFTEVKLLSEPAAAALSYYVENKCKEVTYSLVYDLGGGTFDVAILKRTAMAIDIVAVNGDTKLGGQDFDNLIFDYVRNELIKNYNFDPRANNDNFRRLRTKCTDSKEALSTVHETSIVLFGFVPKHDKIEVVLTRRQFEAMAGSLFKKTIMIVDNCVKSSKIPKSTISEVILSGGSTRIPKIEEMVSAYFGHRKLNKFVNPDECVAEGAAILAASMHSKDTQPRSSKLKLTDVIPLSLGADSLGHKMNFLIKRNTPIPTSTCVNYLTTIDKQTTMTFKIYEGERCDVRKNRLLDKITITDITPAPPSQCVVILTMCVNENGILTVTAKEKFRDNVKQLTVKYNKGTNVEEDVKNTLYDLEMNKEEDEKFKEFVEYKIFLINYCVRVMYNLDNKKLTSKFRGMYDICNETKLAALKMELPQQKQLMEAIKAITLQCKAIAEHYQFEYMPVLNSARIN